MNNIKFLGLIDYQDVISLIRYSIAVINPSLFEGWSSTVEECKSIGKKMILSDIPVHREQNAPDVIYFEPTSYQTLSDILISYSSQFKSVPDTYLETKSNQYLAERTAVFANMYMQVINTINN